MEYRFSGVVTLKDYIQFNKRLPQKSNFSALTLLGAWAAFCIFVDVEWPKGVYFLILFAAVSIVITSELLFVDNCKKGYNSIKFLQEEQRFVINESFIEVMTPSLQTATTKHEIYKVKFDKDSIYLFIGANIAYIIKKRYLKNSDEFDELKEFVKKYYM
jgi:hypothetical protein